MRGRDRRRTASAQNPRRCCCRKTSRRRRPLFLLLLLLLDRLFFRRPRRRRFERRPVPAHAFSREWRVRRWPADDVGENSFSFADEGSEKEEGGGIGVTSFVETPGHRGTRRYCLRVCTFQDTCLGTSLRLLFRARRSVGWARAEHSFPSSFFFLPYELALRTHVRKVLPRGLQYSAWAKTIKLRPTSVHSPIPPLAGARSLLASFFARRRSDRSLRSTANEDISLVLSWT